MSHVRVCVCVCVWHTTTSSGTQFGQSVYEVEWYGASPRMAPAGLRGKKEKKKKTRKGHAARYLHHAVRVSELRLL